MKRIALLGLIVVIAVGAVALLNANLASTTALCKDEPKGGLCHEEIELLHGETNPVKFETAVGTFTCASIVEGHATELATPKGKTLKGEILMAFSSCQNEAKKSCFVTEVTGSPATFNWTSGVSGTVIGNGKGPKVMIVCEKINCTYILESELDINGGKEGTLVASKEKMGSATGPTCPGSGAAISFSGTYPIGSFFVGATIPQVTLCKKNESPCPSEESYGVPSTMSASLEPGNVAKLKLKITEESATTEYTTTCGSSTLEGQTTVAGWPTNGQVTSISFGECGGTCAVKAVNPPFSASLEASGSGNGKITWSPRLVVKCIGAYKCTYEASNLTSIVTGGTPAKISLVSLLNKLIAGESDAKCGAELTWEGAYRFTKPEAGGEAKMWVVREGI